MSHDIIINECKDAEACRSPTDSGETSNCCIGIEWDTSVCTDGAGIQRTATSARKNDMVVLLGKSDFNGYGYFHVRLYWGEDLKISLLDETDVL